MTSCKSVSSPTELGAVRVLRNGEAADEEDRRLMKDKPYRQLVGSLLYVANKTRPDIAAAVGLVARRVADPRISDWEAAKRILRYLSGTKDHVLVYSREGDVQLTGFADADFAMTATRRSITGVVIAFGDDGAAVGWECQQKSGVSLATADAEFYSQSEAVKMLLWLREVMRSIGALSKRVQRLSIKTIKRQTLGARKALCRVVRSTYRCVIIL